MKTRVRVTREFRAALVAALQQRDQKEVADLAEVPETVLSKVLNDRQKSLTGTQARRLVTVLGIDTTTVFPQYTLPLDDRVLEEVARRVVTEMRRWRHSGHVIQGHRIEGFVGVRVDGIMRTVFEGTFSVPAEKLEKPRIEAA